MLIWLRNTSGARVVIPGVSDSMGSPLRFAPAGELHHRASVDSDLLRNLHVQRQMVASVLVADAAYDAERSGRPLEDVLRLYAAAAVEAEVSPEAVAPVAVPVPEPVKAEPLPEPVPETPAETPAEVPAEVPAAVEETPVAEAVTEVPPAKKKR